MTHADDAARHGQGGARRFLLAALGVALVAAAACGPGEAEFAESAQAIKQLEIDNAQLRQKVDDLERALRESPDVLYTQAHEAHDRKDYAAAIRAAELLFEKHPTSDRVPDARAIATKSKRRLAEADAQRRVKAEREARRRKQAEEAARRDREGKVRRLLHGNLDGAGNGFVIGWRWRGETFTLILDERRYVPNSAVAAALTARSVFDTEGVPFPETLVFTDRAGNEIDRGPFANVPRIVP